MSGHGLREPSDPLLCTVRSWNSAAERVHQYVLRRELEEFCETGRATVALTPPHLRHVCVQNYFDSQGVFMSTIVSAPLLCMAGFMVSPYEPERATVTGD